MLKERSGCPVFSVPCAPEASGIRRLLRGSLAGHTCSRGVAGGVGAALDAEVVQRVARRASPGGTRTGEAATAATAGGGAAICWPERGRAHARPVGGRRRATWAGSRPGRPPRVCVLDVGKVTGRSHNWFEAGWGPEVQGSCTAWHTPSGLREFDGASSQHGLGVKGLHLQEPLPSPCPPTSTSQPCPSSLCQGGGGVAREGGLAHSRTGQPPEHLLAQRGSREAVIHTHPCVPPPAPLFHSRRLFLLLLSC